MTACKCPLGDPISNRQSQTKTWSTKYAFGWPHYPAPMGRQRQRRKWSTGAIQRRLDGRCTRTTVRPWAYHKQLNAQNDWHKRTAFALSRSLCFVRQADQRSFISYLVLVSDGMEEMEGQYESKRVSSSRSKTFSGLRRFLFFLLLGQPRFDSCNRPLSQALDVKP